MDGFASSGYATLNLIKVLVSSPVIRLLVLATGLTDCKTKLNEDEKSAFSFESFMEHVTVLFPTINEESLDGLQVGITVRPILSVDSGI